MPTLTALSLTPAARDWLNQTITARVLNAFDRACNLINQEDAILALVTSTRGLNPFAMVVASDDPAPFRVASTTSVVKVEPNRLSLGALQINLEPARLWNPAPDWPVLRQMFVNDSSRFDELASRVMELAVEGSLLDLYRPHPALPAPLLNRARRGATELVNGLLSGSAEQCALGAKTLAGLGGGLTPAGDDFMVGVMLAAWAGLYSPGAEQMCPSIAEAAAPLTTTLSAAYLRAAARGECMARWHKLFESLSESHTENLRLATYDLLSIGHTSGADALAGFLAAHQPDFSKEETL